MEGEIIMKEITAKELAKKLKEEETLSIIDVREEDEVAQGKIPGTLHIALGQLPERLDEIDKDQQYFIVCRSGGRSGKACAFLSDQGYDVTNMVGGMLAWEDEVEK
ncbi:rhodanese [Oceanobacillus iheyensis]|nr:rhodanese [Oceanobacillus iheyensis]